MNFISDALDEYAINHTSPEPDLLSRLSRETNLKILQPRMLSGHFQGRILSIISKLIKPTRILEIGTYTGYSALCLAEGLAENGELHTIDINEELTDIQNKYFNLSPYSEKIITHLGTAIDLIPTIPGTFDLVFIDADKPNYPSYLDLIIEKLNPGGVLLTDNVLWSGKVVQKVEDDDESTRALLKYNKRIVEDNRLETVLLPVRDGLSITRKKTT